MALDPATAATAARIIAPLLKGGTNVRISGTDLNSINDPGKLIAVKEQLTNLVSKNKNKFIKKAWGNAIKEVDKKINELQASQAVKRTSMPNVRYIPTLGNIANAPSRTSVSQRPASSVNRTTRPVGGSLAAFSTSSPRIMPSPVNPASMSQNQAVNAVAAPSDGFRLNDMTVPFYNRPLFWIVSAIGAMVSIVLLTRRKGVKRRRRR